MIWKEVLKKNQKIISIYLLFGIILAFLNNYSASYFQTLIDKFSEGTLSIRVIFIYGGILLFICILNYLDNYPEELLEHGIFLDLKCKALEKISVIDYGIYQTLGTGKLVQRIENGAAAAKSIVFNFFLCLIRQLLPSILFSLIFICRIDRKIMLIILSGYLLVFLVTNLLLKMLYHLKEKILNNEEKLNHYLVRGFMEMLVFRLHKRFDSELKKAKLAKKEIVGSKVRMTLIHEAFFTIFALLVTAIKIAIIAYGWSQKTLTIGSVIALLTLVDNAYTPIAIFNVLYVQYKLDKTAFERYKEFLQAGEDTQLGHGTAAAQLKGEISFLQIQYKINNRILFDNFNLNIRSGEKVAFVGESGSGKSTLIKLLSGLLKPAQGSITIDGYSLGELNLSSYYDHLAYIPQESPIFDGTLRENLVFDGDAEDIRLREALRLVHLEKFLNKLPDGLDTQLGERGITLSGGERQRLALARLWFMKPDIIILDEAASAMDNITEEAVMNHVLELLSDKTVIVIAHRLNSIKGFERIIALRDGKVEGQGSFNELLFNNPYFKELARMAELC